MDLTDFRVDFALSFMPAKHLITLDSFSDYGFALTHLALLHPAYAAWYRRRGKVLLDNSVVEQNGLPASMEQILVAANLVNPDLIVPPDWIADPVATMVAYEDFLEKVPRPEQVVRVLVGDARYMTLGFYASPRAKVFALPYKCPRVAFLKEMVRRKASLSTHHWHLFWYTDLEELLSCVELLAWCGVRGLSFDTAKPLTYAYSGIEFGPRTVSGEAHRPGYSEVLPDAVLRTTLRNISYLRRMIREGLGEQLGS